MTTKHTPGPRSRCKHRFDRSTCPECRMGLSAVCDSNERTISLLVAQRDELLSLLERVERHCVCQNTNATEARRAARAAIARANGEG